MTGRAWCFRDGVDTDALAPGRYMKGSMRQLADHCLEALAPDFAKSVEPGDYVVAGRNFGAGSSREQAAQVLIVLGVRAVIARSYGGIFYRNAFNLGLPALVCRAAGEISPGQHLDVDIRAAALTVRETGALFGVEPVPEHLLEIVDAGGLMALLKQRLGGTA